MTRDDLLVGLVVLAVIAWLVWRGKPAALVTAAAAAAPTSAPALPLGYRSSVGVTSPYGETPYTAAQLAAAAANPFAGVGSA